MYDYTFVISVVSAVICLIFFFPFIKLLYNLKLREGKNTTHRKDPFGKNTPIFNKLKSGKVGIPIGGGILVVIITTIIFFLSVMVFSLDLLEATQVIVIFVFMGMLGLLDDIIKIFNYEGKLSNLRFFQKLILQLILIIPIMHILTSNDIFSLNLPEIFNNQQFIATVLISSSVIVFMSNAVNIVDGVDGLASILLLTTLIPLWIFNWINGNEIGTLLSSILFGTNLAFLYFNIPPARIFMGDTGALAMGAIISVLLYTSQTLYLLPILGLIYILDAMSSIIQLTSKLLFKKKVFTVAPIHHALEKKGWSESKITLRLFITNTAISLLSIAIFFILRKSL